MISRADLPDRSIPFFNTILRCDGFLPSQTHLPEGWSLRSFRPGDEKHWARLEHEIGDFDSANEAETYFVENYLSQPEVLKERCVLAENSSGEVVGACIAWRDPRGEAIVGSVHWLLVAPSAQNAGVGRALMNRVLEIYAQKGEFPVYAHTQPWSYKAILLYLKLGFRLQRSDSFAQYRNEFPQVMATLQTVLTEEQLQFVQEHTDE